MKTCSKCLQTKELKEFYFRKKGKRAGEYYNHCIECLRTRGKTYYHANHVRQLELANKRTKIRRKKLREFVNSLKNSPCTDCGTKYPSYVMDFDHREGCHKKGNIGTLVGQTFFTKEKMLEEIGKCDLVCANCHRIRTFERSRKA